MRGESTRIPMLEPMADDFDDTVIAPSRTDSLADVRALDDTIISQRGIREIRTPAVDSARDGVTSAPASRAPSASRAPVASRFALRVGLGGELVALDVPCYIGRNPHPPRISRETAPRMVTVPSRNKEVSATHLEVREVGSAVVVTDLRSTNGTAVLAPGASPRTLRQGESVVVPAGTLLDLGDENVLQVVALTFPPASDEGARS